MSRGGWGGAEMPLLAWLFARYAFLYAGWKREIEITQVELW